MSNETVPMTKAPQSTNFQVNGSIDEKTSKFYPAVNDLLNKLQKGIVRRIQFAFEMGYLSAIGDIRPAEDSTGISFSSKDKERMNQHKEKFCSSESILDEYFDEIKYQE